MDGVTFGVILRFHKSTLASSESFSVLEWIGMIGDGPEVCRRAFFAFTLPKLIGGMLGVDSSILFASESLIITKTLHKTLEYHNTNNYLINFLYKT